MFKFEKIKFIAVLYIYFSMLINPLSAFETRDYFVVEMLVRSCYKDIKSCDEALLKINNYQKKAVINKKYSCQTRLLGLEANLIMAMNSNLKRKEVKSIIDAIKKYC